MKKLIISTYDDVTNPHYCGGGARVIHEVAKRLSEKFEVTVLSWNHSNNNKETIDGVTYERIGIPTHPKLGNFFFQLLLPFYAKKMKYDVWFESFGPPFTTSFLQLFTKKPVVGVVHMLSAEDMKRKYKISLDRIENAGLRVYNNVIVTSKTLKDAIQDKSPFTKIHVVGNGIERVYKPKKKRDNVFLFVGRIEINQKGIDLLLESFEKFKTTDKEDYKLIIVGYGIEDEVEKMEKLINNHPYRNDVDYKGRVEGKAKDGLYAKAKCLLVTSRFETYSVVSLEALSHGVPVIKYDLSGLKWIPSTCSLTVKQFDTIKYADAMNEVIRDKKYINNASTKGIDYAKSHTWDAISNKYEVVANSLIK